jgi:hypothetical protein
MRYLLIATSLIEMVAGLALLIIPSTAVNAVFGSPLDGASALWLGRLAGAALLTLGITGALASRDATSGAARGFVAAMTLYNLGAGGFLAAAAILSPPAGIFQWPAVVLHAAMALWCIASLLAKPPLTLGKRGKG